jgi:hypothetical protein
LLLGLGVGAQTLATSGSDDIDESAVVLHTLVGTASRVLGLLLGLNLGGLVADLTGTGKRAVHLSAATKTEDQVEGGLLLDIVVATNRTMNMTYKLFVLNVYQQ